MRTFLLFLATIVLSGCSQTPPGVATVAWQDTVKQYGYIPRNFLTKWQGFSLPGGCHANEKTYNFNAVLENGDTVELKECYLDMLPAGLATIYSNLIKNTLSAKEKGNFWITTSYLLMEKDNQTWLAGERRNPVDVDIVRSFDTEESYDLDQEFPVTETKYWMISGGEEARKVSELPTKVNGPQSYLLLTGLGIKTHCAFLFMERAPNSKIRYSGVLVTVTINPTVVVARPTVEWDDH